MNNNLFYDQLVTSLISKSREGDYWDFKLEHHKNCYKLVHDIICLSNIIYPGDRYIIYGVEDKTYNRTGLNDENSIRRTQADIINILRDAPFAQGMFPDIYLDTTTDKKIDIIIIKNKREKPYYLEKNYGKRKDTLHAGTIYSRIRDTNTPRNKVAPPLEISKMWRERFGLDDNPLIRIEKYLLDFKQWISNGINFSYYKTFPEFKLKHVFKEEKKLIGRWWHHIWHDGCSGHDIQFYYYDTILCTSIYVHILTDNFSISYPDVDYIIFDGSSYPDAKNTYSFYSYTEGTFNHSLLCYLMRKSPNVIRKIKIQSQSKTPLKFLPFPIFKNDDEKQKFLKYLTDNITIFNKAAPKLQDVIFHAKSNKYDMALLLTEAKFTYWAYEKYLCK